MAALTRPSRPDLSPHRRSSHPPSKRQPNVRPSKQIKKNEPFDADELARRLEQMNLQTKSVTSACSKRRSLRVGKHDEPSAPIDSLIPAVPTVPSQEREEPIEATNNSVELPHATNPANSKTSGSSDPIRPPTPHTSSTRFRPNSSISAFLATTSPRSQHARPHTMVFDALHNEQQHPNPYHPSLGTTEDGDIRTENLDEAEDLVEEPDVRPVLGPQDRPDWTQSSECGDQLENKHMLLRSKNRRKVVDERDEVVEGQNAAQPYSAQQILSRTTHSVRAPPGATRPDLRTKPRAFSNNDMLSNPPKDANEERRVSQSEALLPRSKARSPRWTDAIASRPDGVTAAERHRDWLEQLRQQERNEAMAREREQREQENLDAKKKAKRKASFRWTLLDKMKVMAL